MPRCVTLYGRDSSVTDLDSVGISCPQLFAAVDPHAVSAEGAVGVTGPPCLCGDLHPWDGGFELPLGPRVPRELDPRGIHTQLPCCSAFVCPFPRFSLSKSIHRFPLSLLSSRCLFGIHAPPPFHCTQVRLLYGSNVFSLLEKPEDTVNPVLPLDVSPYGFKVPPPMMYGLYGCVFAAVILGPLACILCAAH